MNAKPDAREIARLLCECPTTYGTFIAATNIANASPDLRRRLAAAIYPESVERKQGDYQTCTTRGCLNTIWRQA